MFKKFGKWVSDTASSAANTVKNVGQKYADYLRDASQVAMPVVGTAIGGAFGVPQLGTAAGTLTAKLIKGTGPGGMKKAFGVPDKKKQSDSVLNHMPQIRGPVNSGQSVVPVPVNMPSTNNQAVSSVSHSDSQGNGLKVGGAIFILAKLLKLI